MKLETVEVRDLDPRDPVWEAFVPNYPGFREWLSRISSDGRGAWVFRDSGKTAALCIFKQEEGLDTGNGVLPGKVLKLCSFYVAPGYRGRGLAGALLDQAMKHAAAAGCRYVYLHSNNLSTQGFFRRRGFSDAGFHPVAGRFDLIQAREP